MSASSTPASTPASTPEERLAALGVTVPDVAAPVASYVPAVRSGALLWTSGQLPWRDGALVATGLVGEGGGAEVDVDTATDCARQCALNAIAAARAELAGEGGLSAVARVVKIVVFVASAPGFTGQPQVANGASQLLGEAFGEAGRHARSAVGVAALPLGTPVEVEMVVEVAG